MAERSLRGMRIGAHSLESDIGVSFVARRQEAYTCSNNHTFNVTFASEAEAPQTWECKCGAPAELVGSATDDDAKPAKPQRTHWDMLLERRSEEELKVLLEERLALLRAGKLHTRRHS
ncbi:RNA polymerase-binding protein RbpA [Trueperella sp. LYQ143]|uniref:RNA polymerase-binding protein RbpA n=1 Tax=unclassified Trueperella TaxID=2630174 RepID=UPI0039836CA2